MIRFYCDRCGAEIKDGDHVKIEVNRRRRDCHRGKCSDDFNHLREIEKTLSTESLRDLKRKMDEIEGKFLRGEELGSEEAQNPRPPEAEG